MLACLEMWSMLTFGDWKMSLSLLMIVFNLLAA